MRCEICPVEYKKSAKKNAFRWKWRHVAVDGRIEESFEDYELYYECVVAARARGYQPLLKVT